LEITETALMSDVKAASVTLRELRSLGLHLSVDDFGTGYSSLTYLKRFPVEAIKVDRSFVSGLGINAEDSTIVEAVVKLGHSLGLMVVAEGVETPLQLSRLRELGCDRGQGYLFGRPRPAELIESEYSLT
jgi:EAL domain-containing protein (putative c-di-GMP-specific phosphodiesterase class I)